MCMVRDRKAAKFWLNSIRVAYNFGFSATDMAKVESLVRRHEAELEEAWHEYFRSGR